MTTARTGSADTIPAPLARLARERGVLLSYTDAWGHEQTVGREPLLGVLDALGEQQFTAVAAVVVAWDGVLSEDDTARLGHAEILEREDGGEESLSRPAGSPTRPIPFGVHSVGGTTVIAAPRRTKPPDRSWGIFAPTYAIRDARSKPSGDLTSLEQLALIAADKGARYVVTLPLLTQEPLGGGQRAPYSPLSRAFWDESYLDIRRLPEIGSETASLPHSIDARSPEAAAALDAGAERVAEGRGGRSASFVRYLRERPEVASFARFRTRHVSDGIDTEGAARRQVYLQWAMDTQLGEIASTIADAGAGLVLDLPVSCRPDGYDPYAYPGSFANGATIGAPPDDFFTAGQDWALAPIHPERERAAGYPVMRAALDNLARHADILRIDHVAGWQRLWWIPAGAPADAGAYVSYRTDELIALASLYAWRHGIALVGEDLGTIDPVLRARLAEHGISGMDVSVFDLEAQPSTPLRPRSGTLAMLDTHDTATIAGWLHGDDIALRHRLGLLNGAAVTAARDRRRLNVDSLERRLHAKGLSEEGIVASLLEELGESDAAVVVANVEDLWGERDPQNVPGTTSEHPNFCRPMALSLEEIESDLRVASALDRLDRARRRMAEAVEP